MFDEEGRAIHAVRRCINSDCNRMVWHRDVHACLNILHVYIFETVNGFRPAAFTRPFQLQHQLRALWDGTSACLRSKTE